MTAEITPDVEGDEPVSSRRRFLKMGGIGAAAAAATTAAGAIVSPRAAFAAGTMQYDANNTGVGTTTLTNSRLVVTIQDRSATAIYGENVATSPANGVEGVGGTGVYGASIASVGGYGVYGVNNNSGGIGVYGTSNPGSTMSGTGVMGDAGSAYVTGVWARNVNGGTALYAQSNTGTAVSAASTTGAALFGSASGGPPLQITNPSSAIPPTSGSWAAGSFLVRNGHLYYCYVGGTGTASKWAKVSGSYVPLTTPKHAYTSIGKSALSADTSRAVALANFGVPTGARAAVISLSVLNTRGAGWLTCYADGGTNPKVTNLSWWGKGQRMSTEVTVRVSSAAKMRVGNGPSKVDFKVDVLGYYL